MSTTWADVARQRELMTDRSKEAQDAGKKEAQSFRDEKAAKRKAEAFKDDVAANGKDFK